VGPVLAGLVKLCRRLISTDTAREYDICRDVATSAFPMGDEFIEMKMRAMIALTLNLYLGEHDGVIDQMHV
jgi:hypothetical protein